MIEHSIMLILTSTCVGVGLGVRIQKFRQIYLHIVNFCEVAFLTHPFTIFFFNILVFCVVLCMTS